MQISITTYTCVFIMYKYNMMFFYVECGKEIIENSKV